MLIRIGKTRWANLFDVREITISHVKTLGNDKVKFCVHIDSDSKSYDTDTVDTIEEAMLKATKIADALNSKIDY